VNVLLILGYEDFQTAHYKYKWILIFTVAHNTLLYNHMLLGD